MKRLRPGPLAVLAASRVDVAAPWEGPAAEVLNELKVLRGEALSTRPTPVCARSWLIQGNPPLTELLTTTLGERWTRDPQALDRLETLAFDTGFRGAFRAARRKNRERLAVRLRDASIGPVRKNQQGYMI